MSGENLVIGMRHFIRLYTIMTIKYIMNIGRIGNIPMDSGNTTQRKISTPITMT